MKNKGEYIAAFIAATVVSELLLSLLFCADTVSQSGVGALWRMLYSGRMLGVRWLLAAAVSLIILLLIYDGRSIDKISRRKAGQGQYGTARLTTPEEIRKVFTSVTSDKADTPGWVLESRRISKNKCRFLVDTSDQSAITYAPPGSVKTKGRIIPGIYYNLCVGRNTGGRGASMIILDSKGEELNTLRAEAERCGYRIPVLDFRSGYILSSGHYNLMHDVNRWLDKAKSARDENERITARSRAEHYAQLLASSICESAAKATSEASEYFQTTAQGLVTAMILLVSEYGEQSERHISSVFRLIIDLNGLDEGQGDSDRIQRSRLKEMLDLLPEAERVRLFSGAAAGADIKTSMNIFSSALSRLLGFVNAELEQMICAHDDIFDMKRFIEKPTAIFIVVPDEDDSKNFFASLLIRQFIDSLIELSHEYPGDTLPRPVQIWWDEFGQAPYIKKLTSTVTAGRSRGIRCFLYLQSPSQLGLQYSHHEAETIRENLQILSFAAPGADAYKVAEDFSKNLGTYTAQSGTTSTNSRSNGFFGAAKNQSVSLISRPLMTADEIMTMPPGQYVVRKPGCHPIKIQARLWWDCFSLSESDTKKPLNGKIKKIDVLTEAKLRERYAPQTNDHPLSRMRGTFDRQREEDIDTDLNPPPDCESDSKPKKSLKRKKVSR